MAKLNTKIKLYAAANGVANVDFMNDVIVLKEPNKDPVIDSWGLDIAEPTAEQLASYETAGNTEDALNAVLNKRAREYLSWQQQMEMIYKDQKNGTTTFKDHCDKVRSDNPKG